MSCFFFFSSRRRHTRCSRDWSSDVCSSDLSRSIVDAVSHFRARDPERVERLWQRIEGYRALLAEYHVKDEAVRARLEPQRRARRIRLGWQAVVGLPLFAYGASVNLLPYWIPRWTARRMARKEIGRAHV